MTTIAVVGPRYAKKRGGWSAPALLRLARLFIAIAVIAQLVALDYHYRVARPDVVAIAAELKVTFGPAAVLCTQSDDPSSPTPDRQQGGCDAGCPLCQFASHAVLLETSPPALPERLAIADGPSPSHADLTRPRASTIRFAQPRAPPFFA